jgi:hypothetical protein
MNNFNGICKTEFLSNLFQFSLSESSQIETGVHEHAAEHRRHGDVQCNVICTVSN